MALVGDNYDYYDKAFYDLTVPIARSKNSIPAAAGPRGWSGSTITRT